MWPTEQHWRPGLTPACAAALAITVASAAAGELVRPELVADVAGIRPGQPFSLGVLFHIQGNWHIYWKSPGDAGLATAIEWRLPAGFKAGEVRWPVPETFRQEGGIVTYGYARSALLSSRVEAPKALAGGRRAVLRARVSWLACQGRCVPGEAELQLELPVVEEARGANGALFAAWREQLAVDVGAPASPGTARVTGEIGAGAKTGKFAVELAWARRPAGVEWLPAPGEGVAVDHVRVRTRGRRTAIRFLASLVGRRRPAVLESLVLYTEGDGTRKGVRVCVPLVAAARRDGEQ